MITEGYMVCVPKSFDNIEEKLPPIISALKKSHPDFKFNTCLTSELNTTTILTIEGIIVVPYSLPKDHFWFVFNPDEEIKKYPEKTESWRAK